MNTIPRNKILLFLFVLSILTGCKTLQTGNHKLSGSTQEYQGGMWIPSELKGKNEKEMKALGSKLTADDIYSLEEASLKDAVVLFDGGCTAEIISSQGLLLTNHHCGYNAIQSHSTVEHDYLKDGFWATSLQDELPNEDMTVTLVERMVKVTEQILKDTEGLNDEQKEKIIKKNKKQILSGLSLKEWEDAQIVPFSKGNDYYLIVSKVFRDIRLVGAPPSSIGKFGADTDNWMWPRHSGDFSLFRIYVDKNNNPAKYSEDNVPYHPDKYLKVSTDGVAEGDFTMVFGFPGRTNEYLPSVAIDQLIHKLNPDKIALREASLAIMDKYMRKDPAVKIQYASKYASIANYWKKWIGEMQGLQRTQAVEKKRAMEEEFLRRAHQKNRTEYYGIFDEFDDLFAEYGDIAQRRDYWIEVIYRNIDLMHLNFALYGMERTYMLKGEKAFFRERDKWIEKSPSFYKNYSPHIDKEIFAKLMYMYDAKYPTTKVNEKARREIWEKKANDIYTQSRLTTHEGLLEMLKGSPEEIIKRLNADPAYQLSKEKSIDFLEKINPAYYTVKEKIDAFQKKYIRGLAILMPEQRMFPDANSTLRITYGLIKGYKPKDGITYLPVSYLQGVMQKYIPGDYEFDVSPKLRALYRNKDYGVYGEGEKMPVNFIGTNHTTGGNSGSPVLDAYGNLIGLNFDRVWEGTMSDYYYDPEICRNIMVDIRYILFIIDKYAEAERIIRELDFVHPKNKQ